MGSDLLPITVIVATLNEAPRIEACLTALTDFAEIVVVDSGSTDQTKTLAEQAGARVIDFQWNGQYPKKRQWCLDNLQLAHDWVFFVDADEIVTPELVEELHGLDFSAAGYFVHGRYVFGGKPLRFGLMNNKLALLDRRKMEFPVIDDLDLSGMGEIEGHYQPVLKSGYEAEKIGKLRAALLHEAYEDESSWLSRHQRYAAWETGMNRKRAWPGEVSRWRGLLKRVFRALPFRGFIAFVHCYVMKAGFLDGAAGLRFAQSRWRYYEMIGRE